MLFNEQKKFAYMVLDATLLMDKGKSLVWKHQAMYDTQAIWKEHQEHTCKSTKAQLAQSDLLMFITSTRYNKSWKGTSEHFVLFWQDKV